MKRRTFITLLGGAAATWPTAARAQQQPAIPVVGFLSSASPDLYAIRLRTFRQALKEAGYVEDQNVSIEFRWAEGQNDRLPTLAAELVHRQVAVIAAAGTPSAVAAKAATATIPIVFGVSVDPVKVELVASLNRPGGNLTGVTSLNVEIGPKKLELLPATSFAVEAISAPVRDRSELETVIAAQAREPNGGLIAMPDSFLEVNRVEITSLAARYRLPAVYPFRLFAEVGGLLSYGVDRTDNFRRAATYVDRIFKGENPAELPVQAPIKFELVVNLKTAKAIALDVPLHLQQLADEIIE
jgi:putative tryptophan/tyrosine transport system substrate-binding protein